MDRLLHVAHFPTTKGLSSHVSHKSCRIPKVGEFPNSQMT
uniref:Uncharacterized protein n=1 Tax=Anguilla anguilla TaxID=7936 RepID=A0A0E9S671_ANGAN